MFNQFLSGAVCFGFFIAATFFFRFWNKTRDRLFLMFSFSFLLMAIEKIIVSCLLFGGEFQFYIYGIRLLAFILLIYAILDKNHAK
ncbi:MAG TPA: DUF5985 family protein [Verrucomicrobiae bacterium]|jgi:hypothetical protein|nr:DUF5985 family protein [Verrucomicrobiae bacterium]